MSTSRSVSKASRALLAVSPKDGVLSAVSPKDGVLSAVSPKDGVLSAVSPKVRRGHSRSQSLPSDALNKFKSLPFSESILIPIAPTQSQGDEEHKIASSEHDEPAAPRGRVASAPEIDNEDLQPSVYSDEELDLRPIPARDDSDVPALPVNPAILNIRKSRKDDGEQKVEQSPVLLLENLRRHSVVESAHASQESGDYNRDNWHNQTLETHGTRTLAQIVTTTGAGPSDYFTTWGQVGISGHDPVKLARALQAYSLNKTLKAPYGYVRKRNSEGDLVVEHEQKIDEDSIRDHVLPVIRFYRIPEGHPLLGRMVAISTADANPLRDTLLAYDTQEEADVMKAFFRNQYEHKDFYEVIDDPEDPLKFTLRVNLPGGALQFKLDPEDGAHVRENFRVFDILPDGEIVDYRDGKTRTLSEGPQGVVHDVSVTKADRVVQQVGPDGQTKAIAVVKDHETHIVTQQSRSTVPHSVALPDAFFSPTARQQAARLLARRRVSSVAPDQARSTQDKTDDATPPNTPPSPKQ